MKNHFIEASGEGITKARKLAYTLLGDIQYGDSRDTPKWRESVIDSAESYLLLAVGVRLSKKRNEN